MNKSGLNGSMLFKMRNGVLYALLCDYEGDFIFYDADDIKAGYNEGTIMFDDIDNNLLAAPSKDYDIVAIKQRNGCVRVIADVLGDKEPEEWDWVEEVEKPKEKSNVMNLTLNITIDPNDVQSVFRELHDKISSMVKVSR